MRSATGKEIIWSMVVGKGGGGWGDRVGGEAGV